MTFVRNSFSKFCGERYLETIYKKMYSIIYDIKNEEFFKKRRKRRTRVNSFLQKNDVLLIRLKNNVKILIVDYDKLLELDARTF